MSAGRLRVALVSAIVVATVGGGIALAHSTSRDTHAQDYQRCVRQYVDGWSSSAVDVLARRFAEAEHARNPRVSILGHSTMTAGAWSYLCSSVREDETAPRSRDED